MLNSASPGDPAERAILLLGAQRSGTTWLGKILDSHPDVLYRNEPDIGLPARPGVTSAALRATVNTWIGQTDLRTAGKRPLFRKSWQSAAAFGLRYGLVGLLTAAARAPVLGRLAARASLPDLASASRAGSIRPVLKSINWCDGAGDFARGLPDSRTLLILRHPCGQVASVMRGAAQRRFELRAAGTDMPFDEAQAIGFAARHGVSAPDFQALPDAAKYAWSWRAFNETAFAALDGLPNARVVLYEDLCAAPEAEARDALAFCGLDWNPQTGDFLARSSSHAGSAAYYAVFRNSAGAADRWRATMPAADQAAVRAVVRQSRLARFWRDTAGTEG
jgi:hypothetical protein